jgi:hypothetical protein
MGLNRFIESEKKNTVREVHPVIGGSSLQLFPLGNIAPVSYQTLRSLEREGEKQNMVRLIVISDTHGLHNRIDGLRSPPSL